jgi:glutamyl-Q tRNA(Asp) synthetase
MTSSSIPGIPGTPKTGYVGRFAPSPTGPLHFGSLIAALASWLDARHHQGRWLLRIEDLDPPRESTAAPARIMAQLTQLGLHWDGEPLWQSQRLPAYQQALETLISRQSVFPCTCSRSQLPAVYPGTCRNQTFHSTLAAHAIRFRLPAETRLTLNDRVLGSQSWHLQQSIGDFVVKRKDGLFAYQLAVTVDDAYQQVTHVVRGSDLLDSSPRQACLGAALGYPPLTYAHIPLALDQQGLKLSKSTQAPAVPQGTPIDCIRQALGILGQPQMPQIHDLRLLLATASQQWSIDRVPKCLALAVPEER